MGSRPLGLGVVDDGVVEMYVSLETRRLFDGENAVVVLLARSVRSSRRRLSIRGVCRVVV